MALTLSDILSNLVEVPMLMNSVHPNSWTNYKQQMTDIHLYHQENFRKKCMSGYQSACSSHRIVTADDFFPVIYSVIALSASSLKERVHPDVSLLFKIYRTIVDNVQGFHIFY